MGYAVGDGLIHWVPGVGVCFLVWGYALEHEVGGR